MTIRWSCPSPRLAALATLLFCSIITSAPVSASPMGGNATPASCIATPIAPHAGVASPGVTAPTPQPTDASSTQQEQNPAGDIPDNQAFVPYTSMQGGYRISMPEGWARTEDGPNVTFSDKLHTFSVAIVCASAAPSQASAQAEVGPGGSIAVATPGFELVGISTLQVPAGNTVVISYRSDSAPDDVTGKSHRIDIQRYELFRNGHMAVITLATPAGSDNVDVARQVTESFAWLG